MAGQRASIKKIEQKKINTNKNMLKIEVKPGENIERALKRYKRKYRNTKRLEQIRDRQQFTKKSVSKRKELKKAIYKEQYLLAKDNE